MSPRLLHLAAAITACFAVLPAYAAPSPSLAAASPSVAARTTTVTSHVTKASAFADDDTAAIDWSFALAVGGNVLSNDSTSGNNNNNNNNAVLVTGASNGALTLQPNGIYRYTPSPNFYGDDAFTYKIDTDTGPSNIATVTITVPPWSHPDSYTVPANKPFTQASPGVLGNDGVPPHTALNVITAPNHAVANSFVLNLDGSFTYTPEPGFTGTDSFTYSVTAAEFENPNTATVTITVPEPPPPVGTGDTYSVVMDTALAIAAPGVLTNFAAPEGQVLIVSVVTPPANGSLVLNIDGSFTYRPNPKFEGADTFTYIASYDSSKAARASSGNAKAAPFVDSPPVTATINVTAAVTTTPPTGSGATAQAVPTLGHAGLVVLSGLVACAAALRRRKPAKGAQRLH